MDRDKKPSTAPQPVSAEPVVLPDVATQPHPGAGGPLANQSEAGPEQLQEVLPQISEVAQKVGGFRKLADIAKELDQQGE